MKTLLRTFTTLTIMACILPVSFSCETQQELDEKMDLICGDYLLKVFPVYGQSYRDNEQDFDAISTAHIFQYGDKWYFDYTVPLYFKGEGRNPGRYVYHHMQQEVVWDRQLGIYCFFRLAQEDLPAGWAVEDVDVRMEGKAVTLITDSGNYSWIRQ